MLEGHGAYDHLPVGVLVLRDGVMRYANTAVGALIGMSVQDLLARPVDEVLPGASALVPTAEAEGPQPANMFVVPRGRRPHEGALRVVCTPGSDADEWVLTVVDADVEAATVPLAEAMVVAAGQFARCTDEQEVFERALDAIYARGYLNVLMLLDPGRTYLTAVAMRQDPRVVQMGDEVYGLPAVEVRFELEKIPYLAQVLQTGRAAFHPDGLSVMRAVHVPQAVELLEQTVGPVRMIDAPIYVDGEPFGVLSVQGSRLTAASATTVELFARLVGGAVENVRHHREAATRAQEVSALQRELVTRERLAAVGQAAGLLSHEARNPLGAILNALAVLRRRNDADGGALELIDIAEEEALRLDALVRDLLELARPLEPRVRATPVPSAVDGAIASLRRRSRTGLPPIDVQVPDEVPEVVADPTLLGLALDNLLRNAVQAGGGARVRVTVERSDGLVTVAVQDGGPPARRPAEGAFDPFSLDAARGTGLGLAVVKRVADAQGVTVRANPEGTRLELSLPVASPTAAASGS